MNVTLHITWKDQQIDAQATAGEPLIEALTRAGVTVTAPCGGHGTCGKCRVRVESGGGEPAAAELRLLNEAELRAGWRLACACTVTDGMRVSVDEAEASVLV